MCYALYCAHTHLTIEDCSDLRANAGGVKVSRAPQKLYFSSSFEGGGKNVKKINFVLKFPARLEVLQTGKL